MKTCFTYLIITTLSLLLRPQTTNAQCHIDDWTALKAFYETTTNWSRSEGWSETFSNKNTPQEACNLENLIGISLNETGRVKRISVGGFNIRGSFFTKIGLLTELEDIFLQFNELSGSIPPEIGNLKKLTLIYMSNNKISGPIPETLGNLTNLTQIEIANNRLSGNIPAQLGNLNNLERLVLESNNLNGAIPATLGNLSNLNTLFLSNNNLNGAIPNELANLSKLSFFDLSNNRLTENIPNGLGDLPELKRFLLNNNNLTGSLPEGLGQQAELFAVHVNNNNLSGCYPPNLAALCDDIEDGNSFVSNRNNFDTSWNNFCKTGNGVCAIDGEAVILDCTDTEACNYNPNANYENGSCIYYDIQLDCPCGTIAGCTDTAAKNYDASADCDNGFCEYENALQPGEYDYVFCRNFALNVSLAEICPDGNFNISENVDNIEASVNSGGYVEIDGLNDGESHTITISNNSNTSCNAEWTFNLIGSKFPECRDLKTDEVLLYVPWVTNIVNNLNCEDVEVLLIGNSDYDVEFPPVVYINTLEGGTLYSNDGRFLCADYTDGETLCENQFYGVGGIQSRWICPNSMLIPGCTNPEACNYNPEAQTEDGNCDYGNRNCDAPCNNILGCTDEIALNYNPGADCDDDSCEYETTIIPKCHINDWTALRALYNDTKGDNWINNSGWEEITGNVPFANCNLANMFGVTLDIDNRVDTIDLSSNGLNGLLHNQWSNLSHLKYLSLNYNQLRFSSNLNSYGLIPPTIGDLSSLEYLSLVECSLDGDIPAELGNLSNLKELHLNNNLLRWSIPPELGNLQNLEVLSLWRNRLVENIPAELGNLTNLKWLSLADNKLTGSIPPELGNLNELAFLSLDRNELTGSIPSELGNLNNLMELNLQNNQLNGSIPTELGNLSNLSNLWLFSNELSGNIPAELGNLNNLKWLSLRDNQLSGNIPTELGNLSSLEKLSLRNNQLSESIPTELGNLSNLKELYLNNNQFNGSMPPPFGNLINLVILEIYDNNLSGCFSTNLNTLCTQIVESAFGYQAIISGGNNFDATWGDFCNTEAGACARNESPPSIGTFECE